MIKKMICFIFCIMIYGYSSCTFPQTNKSSHPLYVVSFNILAPCWASATHYPASTAPYLNRELRRSHIINFLNSVADKADIIALQEVTEIEFGFIKNELQTQFYAFMAYHDPLYESEWITQDPPWEPNGVAIFVKKNQFHHVSFQDLALTNDGNHSAYFEGVQSSTGTTIRAASIHLNNEHGANRYRELHSLSDFMSPRANTKDIIAGDFNIGTQTGKINYLLTTNNFIDNLHVLNHEEWTSPFDSDGDKNAGIIDHIVTRNLIPLDGHVQNFDLWQTFPKDEVGRIIANLQLSGSDHFPIFSIME